MKLSGWQQYLKVCNACKTTAELDEFFKFFLTPDEQQQMANRVEVVKRLLHEKETQREIAANMKVSIAMITRGSNMLKLCSGKMLNFLKKVLL